MLSRSNTISFLSLLQVVQDRQVVEEWLAGRFSGTIFASIPNICPVWFQQRGTHPYQAQERPVVERIFLGIPIFIFKFNRWPLVGIDDGHHSKLVVTNCGATALHICTFPIPFVCIVGLARVGFFVGPPTNDEASSFSFICFIVSETIFRSATQGKVSPLVLRFGTSYALFYSVDDKTNHLLRRTL